MKMINRINSRGNKNVNNDDNTIRTEKENDEHNYICNGSYIKANNSEEEILLKLIQSEEIVKAREDYYQKEENVKFSQIKHSDPLAMGIFLIFTGINSVSISDRVFKSGIRMIIKWKIPSSCNIDHQQYLQKENQPSFNISSIGSNYEFKYINVEKEEDASYLVLDVSLDFDSPMSCGDKFRNFPFDSYECGVSVTYSSRNSDHRLRRFSLLDDTKWQRDTDKNKIGNFEKFLMNGMYLIPKSYLL